jgi:hypothetical protein
MNRELWVSILTFAAMLITLAGQFLAVPPDLEPWLVFSVAVINAALAIFFGVTGIKTRNAAKAARAK